MTASQISWILLALGVALLILTIFGPCFLNLTWWKYALYSFSVGILWCGYTVIVMPINDKVGTDVPGIGYLFLGFLAWLIGSTVFLCRTIFRKTRPPMPANRRTPDHSK
jgi:hypothetical protein